MWNVPKAAGKFDFAATIYVQSKDVVVPLEGVNAERRLEPGFFGDLRVRSEELSLDAVDYKTADVSFN